MALSDKQVAFVNEYLVDYNATRAAERAGYQGNENTLAVTGHDLLRNPKISELVEKRLQEKALKADEVLMRLGDQARGNMGDFIRFNDNGDPALDLQGASVLGKLHLIKKLKTKTRSWNEPTINLANGEIEYREMTETIIECELYDNQKALELIGKHYRLFVDGPTGEENDPLHIKLDV